MDDKEVLADLTDNWDFFVISGHGYSIPDDYQKVPENTYLIFNAPAGCIATGKTLPYSDVLVGTKTEFIRNFYLQHVRAVDRLHRVSVKKPVMFGDEDFLLRTLAPSERAELQTCVFPSEFYDPKFKPRTSTLCRIGPAFAGKTIYGPGESYPNNMIHFQSEPTPITFWLGVYELPIPTETYTTVTTVADATAEKMDKLKAQVKAGVLNPGKDGLRKFRDMFDKSMFSAKTAKNLREDLLGHHVELSRILEELPPVPAGKSRFLFVTSCRGIFARADKPAGAAQIAALMRQASVETENTAAAEYAKKAKAAAEEYYAAEPAADVAATVTNATATGGAGTTA